LIDLVEFLISEKNLALLWEQKQKSYLELKTTNLSTISLAAIARLTKNDC